MADEKTTSKSFEANYRKLEQLSQQLQNNQVSVDELVPRMKEALSAIRICKEVLKETKVQLQQIGAEFEEVSTPLEAPRED